MVRFVLSDAAPLIYLAQVDGLPWLKVLFGKVHITQEVRGEVLTGAGKPGEEALFQAIERGLLHAHSEWSWTMPQFPNLGAGEASCLRAAVNVLERGDDCLLLMDDRAGRREALSLSIATTGTAGLVGAARRAGLIPSADAVFAELRRRDFRISEPLVQSILQSLGERSGVKPSKKKLPR